MAFEAFQAISFGQYPLRAPTQYVCESTDVKVTANISDGAQLLETDTGLRYVFKRVSSTLYGWVLLTSSPELERFRTNALLETLAAQNDEIIENQEAILEQLMELNG